MHTKVASDVLKELQGAMKVNPLFTSPHHGYAIILEELDELWDEVKKKRSECDMKNMRAEAVQVAAMAMKFIMSMDNEWKPESSKGSEEELRKIEVTCSRCLYDFVTKEMNPSATPEV